MTAGALPAGSARLLRPEDDLRHHAEPGGRMRDSLFWEMVIPEAHVGMQVYLYVTGTGRAGYNAVVWGPDPEPLVLHLGSGRLPVDADFDDLVFDGLSLRQTDPLQSCVLTYRKEEVALDFEFQGIHDAFTYHRNPDGLPVWFARDRMEQTGRVRGQLTVGSRRIELDGIGHRDHSWGVRDWAVPQHWKWFVAYTPAGVAVNGWVWIARGEWGFAGYVAREGRAVPVASIDHHATYDAAMHQKRLTATLIDVEGATTDVELDVFGVVELAGGDRVSTVIREAACAATIDGVPGAGQFETQWTGSYLTGLLGSPSRR